MNQLVESYAKTGLVSDDSTKYFQPCDICGESFHFDDLITTDCTDYCGEHCTVEICDECVDKFF